MLFDTHCHLDDPQLRQLLPGLLRDAEAQGVTAFVVPGVAPEGWGGIAEVAASLPNVYPAFGIHPMHAGLLTPAALSDLRRLCDGAVAVGEIGLDYLLDNPAPELQQHAFRLQLRLALDSQLPVLIHCRKAFNDLLSIIDEEGGGTVAGVMHAFSGSSEIARECLKRGLHISLAGSVTYGNAVRPVAVARAVPLERLLLETDAPDLAPEPFRGKMNLPAYLAATAQKIADLRGLTLQELATATTANANRLFRLPSPLSVTPVTFPA